jgi:hypothetical protein
MSSQPEGSFSLSSSAPLFSTFPARLSALFTMIASLERERRFFPEGVGKPEVSRQAGRPGVAALVLWPRWLHCWLHLIRHPGRDRGTYKDGFTLAETSRHVYPPSYRVVTGS